MSSLFLPRPLARRLSVSRKQSGTEPKFMFELVGEQQADGTTAPVKGCKTDSKGRVVQGTCWGKWRTRGTLASAVSESPFSQTTKARHDRYLFRGENQAEVRDWIQAIQAAIRQDNVLYDLYSQRRNKQIE